MFDTSVFNYIHSYNLYSQVESFFTQNKDITVYICDTQFQEISAISDLLRKERLTEMIQNISVQTVLCSLGFVGIDENSPHKFGYRGARVGLSRVADIDESKLEGERLIGSASRNPLGDAADLSIIDTAITEEMDYLITRDKKMESLLARLMKVRIYHKEHPELKIKLINEKGDLMDFLSNIVSS